MTVSLIKTPAATPARMPMKQTRKTIRAVPKMTQHARCASGPACTGPGCRVSTGKTARKSA